MRVVAPPPGVPKAVNLRVQHRTLSLDSPVMADTNHMVLVVYESGADWYPAFGERLLSSGDRDPHTAFSRTVVHNELSLECYLSFYVAVGICLLVAVDGIM